MKKITAVIIEDEPLSSLYLTGLLQAWCAEVEVLATVGAYNEAIAAINQLEPQLIFLDIDLLDCTGFDVLKGLSGHHPSIIFTAAFGDATLNMIKPCGLPYLQKPIDGEELAAVVNKTMLQRETLVQQQLQLLLQRLDGEAAPAVLYAETVDGGFLFIDTAAIVSIEASGAGTVFTLLDKDAVQVMNLSMKDCECFLRGEEFCRVSQKHIINKAFVENFCDGMAPCVVMKNGACIPVTAKKVEALRAALG